MTVAINVTRLGAAANGQFAATGKPSLQDQAASGALAGFMRQNGVKDLDMNALSELANGTFKGEIVPPGVQAAAKHMMANPDLFKKLETHDNPEVDGKSGVDNFDWMAQGGPTANQAGGGDVAGGPSTAAPAHGAGAPGAGEAGAGAQGATQGAGEAAAGADSKALQGQAAAGALAGFMNKNGLSDLTPEDLYKMSQGDLNGKKVPEAVREAAKFMLANPDVFKQIADGDKAGKGGSAGAGAPAGADQGGQGAGAAPQAPAQGASTQDPQGAGAASPSGGEPSSKLQAAAGTLANFLKDKGVSSIDMNDLYKLALGGKFQGQAVPPAVQDAAKNLLANPDQLRQFETNSASSAEGHASVKELDKAAQGL